MGIPIDEEGQTSGFRGCIEENIDAYSLETSHLAIRSDCESLARSKRCHQNEKQ
jgi:hypothetical protein